MNQINHGVETSNITDIPRKAGDDDLLSVDGYTRALERFISQSETPMTIAIQGEWGSGKTSMMNQIRDHLCRDEAGSFIPIWLNTWQYSLFSDEEKTLLRIIKGLFDQVVAVMDPEAGGKAEKVEKAKKIFGHLARGAMRAGATMVGAGAVADEVIKGMTPDSSAEAEVTVNDLRDALDKAIGHYLESDSLKRRGFLIFIDDLDRIEPVMAVKILELLKNIFDIERCLFVLAIDYDVVVKGLEPKFGKWTSENEREFRSFFDKIIQLPFSMPVGSYKIDGFLLESLKRIGYFSDGELEDPRTLIDLSKMTTVSVGTNPRAMKRLTNILSLIKIFNALSNEHEEKNDELFEKKMNYGLVCLQLAYPKIYSLLTRDPDFLSWDDAKAEHLRLPELDEEAVTRLSSSEMFDDEWERVLFRYCLSDSFLENSAYSISCLLNIIARIAEDKKGRSFGELMEELLSLTSVTEVEVSGEVKREKHQRVYVDGLDSYKQSKSTEGYSQKSLDLMGQFHDLVLEVLKQQGAEVDVKYSGMINFFVEGQRGSVIKSWMLKRDGIYFIAHLGSGEENPFPDGLISSAKGKDEYTCKLNSVSFPKYRDAVITAIRRSHSAQS